MSRFPSWLVSTDTAVRSGASLHPVVMNIPSLYQASDTIPIVGLGCFTAAGGRWKVQAHLGRVEIESPLSTSIVLKKARHRFFCDVSLEQSGCLARLHLSWCFGSREQAFVGASFVCVCLVFWLTSLLSVESGIYQSKKTPKEFTTVSFLGSGQPSSFNLSQSCIYFIYIIIQSVQLYLVRQIW